MELWYRLYPLVWPQHGRDLLSLTDRAATRQSRTTLVRMMSGHQGQGWHQTHRVGRRPVLCAAPALDRRIVDQRAECGPASRSRPQSMQATWATDLWFWPS